MKTKKFIQRCVRLSIIFSLMSIAFPGNLPKSPISCAIRTFYVFPGKALTQADKKFLPNILTNHPFYS